MTNRVLSMVVVMMVAVFAACATDVGRDADRVGVTTQALSSDRARVIHECSQAMTGSWWTYDETNWPTGTTYGSYAYISNDLGAWGKLLDNTYNGTVRGWWTSCRKTTSVQNYSPCFLSYGDLDTASTYDCQGTCTSGIQHRGGQCKPFMNLVAYRSGLYQNPGYAWKSFPTDACIQYTTASCNTASPVVRPTSDADMPMATYANIEPGDYLRQPYGHALIIVRKIDSSNVIVLDSNWSGGDGAEKISSHVMAFSGSGNSNLGNYRVLKCAYSGTC